MNVDARISKEWLKRMGLLLLILVGGGAWFFYDGYIGYPKAAERHAEFMRMVDEMKEAGKARSADDESVRLAWAERARSNGWKVEKPKEITDAQIREQKVIGSLLIAGALVLLGWVVLSMRQSVKCDGETVTGPDGKSIHLDEFHALDKRKWKNKGIVYALYSVAGKERRLTLDDYKFAGAVEVIEEIERRLNARSGQTSRALEQP